MSNKDDEMSKDDVEEVVEEVTETEEVEVEESEATETVEEAETEEVEEDDSTEEEHEAEPEPVVKQPKKVAKKQEKKEKQEDDSDADEELDKFFSELKKRKERQRAKEKEAEKKSEKSEKMFTQAEFEKALKATLAKKLPPKEEMEQYKKWRESQQTVEEKLSVLTTRNSKLEDELESLKHENLIIKAGVDKEAIDYVQFNVEKMSGDFEENLEEYLSSHKQYLTPKQVVQRTTVVEGAEHKKQTKPSITKKELDAMGYPERLKFREEHPEEYAKAMGR